MMLKISQLFILNHCNKCRPYLEIQHTLAPLSCTKLTLAKEAFLHSVAKKYFMGEWWVEGDVVVNFPQRFIYWGRCCCKLPSKVHLWVCVSKLISL